MQSEDTTLSVRQQCTLLQLPRSSFYYKPAEVDDDDLQLMRAIDALHLEHPFYGSRKIAHVLSAQKGQRINRKRVQRLMRLMDIVAMAPAPKTSDPRVEAPVFPYLLRRLDICRINQVWAADITYIPMAHGYVYLVAIIDWYSRRVLSWRLSNTMDVSFCVEALTEALATYGAPDIFNTDQGAQFTSEAFVQTLLGHGIRVSHDGKGRCLDNVFVERLWRSLKYEEVYLHDYESIAQARVRIGWYLEFYNTKRPHAALGYQTPAAFYDGFSPLLQLAA